MGDYCCNWCEQKNKWRSNANSDYIHIKKILRQLAGFLINLCSAAPDSYIWISNCNKCSNGELNQINSLPSMNLWKSVNNCCSLERSAKMVNVIPSPRINVTTWNNELNLSNNGIRTNKKGKLEINPRMCWTINWEQMKWNKTLFQWFTLFGE